MWVGKERRQTLRVNAMRAITGDGHPKAWDYRIARKPRRVSINHSATRDDGRRG